MFVWPGQANNLVARVSLVLGFLFCFIYYYYYYYLVLFFFFFGCLDVWSMKWVPAKCYKQLIQSPTAPSKKSLWSCRGERRQLMSPLEKKKSPKILTNRVISFIIIVLIKSRYYPINKIIFFIKWKINKKERNTISTKFFTTLL